LPLVIISISNVKIAVVFTALSPGHFFSGENICSFLIHCNGVLLPRYAQQQSTSRGKSAMVCQSASAAPPGLRLDRFLHKNIGVHRMLEDLA
jgi:hypothetical protein